MINRPWMSLPAPPEMTLVQFKPRRRSPEADLQRRAFCLLPYILPRDCFVTHFPLGGGGLAHGQRMKALGSIAGIPDLLCLYRGAASWIELKAPDGDLTAIQRNMHDRLRECGCRVEVARSLREVVGAIRSFGVPLKDMPVGGLDKI